MQVASTLANDEGDAAPHARAVGPHPGLDRWAVAAIVAGNALEFYDFLAYTTFAVYIGKAFFPMRTELASLLLSLATFGVGFFTRPLGGLLIGAYSDRAGRRPALVLTISLMALGTLAVAVTPPYATIGIAAPLILVAARLIQGLALGGEVGPSTAALLECAPPGRGGAYISWQASSQGMAILTAGLVGFVLGVVLNKEQLADWGWRVPFALGLIVVPVGLYIRRRLPETLLAPGTRRSSDVLRLVWQGHRRSLVLAILIGMCLTITAYVLTYMTTYSLTTLGLPASTSMLSTLTLGVIFVAGAFSSGRLADRFGRKPVMILSRIAVIVAVYPAFAFLVGERTGWALVSVTALLSVLGLPSIVAAQTAVIEIFPNQVRSCAFAIGYAVSVAIFGGTTQFVIAWLIGVTGDPLSPAYYVILTSLISLWAMFQLPETRKS
ncbi:MAG TPA: MFS transporter [Burkholderiaceae bacterium]|jgi:MFS family permease|nr:MFS transporter [Burkholderiaceae bacterium]